MNISPEIFKVITLGDIGTGKSGLIHRFTEERFTCDYAPTIGVDFKVKTINISHNNVKFQIWDTAGQERFRSIIRGYYRGVHAAILVFDLGNYKSFNHLSQWLEDVNNYCCDDVVKIIAACKSDTTQIVTDSELSLFNAETGIPIIKCSAKTGQGIDELFSNLGAQLLKTRPEKFDMDPASKVRISPQRKRNKCC